MMHCMEQVMLTKSVVYEALQLELPVSIQYGRARRVFVLESHDANYEVCAGEMLFGYQPFTMKDLRVFDQAE